MALGSSKTLVGPRHQISTSSHMPELQGTAVVQNKPPSAVALLKLPCLHRRDTSYSQSQQTAAWLGRQQTASGFPAGYCLLHVAIASYPRLLGFPRSLSGRAAKPHQIAHVITSVPPDPTLLWVLELSCFQLLLHENAPGTKYWCMPKDVPGMLLVHLVVLSLCRQISSG